MHVHLPSRLLIQARARSRTGQPHTESTRKIDVVALTQFAQAPVNCLAANHQNWRPNVTLPPERKERLYLPSIFDSACLCVDLFLALVAVCHSPLQSACPFGWKTFDSSPHRRCSVQPAATISERQHLSVCSGYEPDRQSEPDWCP